MSFSMYPIKSLDAFQRAIDNQWPMSHRVSGIIYRLDSVTALNMKVIDILEKIKSQTIFYQPDC